MRSFFMRVYFRAQCNTEHLKESELNKIYLVYDTFFWDKREQQDTAGYFWKHPHSISERSRVIHCGQPFL